MSGISSPFNALRCNSQEVFTVRCSTSWRSLVVLRQISRDLLSLQNPISDVCTLFSTLGEKSPRSPDFVLQLDFCLKWPYSKFGIKPLKPGGATPENVFFSLFCSFFEMALFHFHIFLVFESLGFKLGRLLVWSMI